MGKVAAVIPAAGQGKRMGTGQNKVFLSLRDKPVLAYTLDIFQVCGLIDEVVLVAAHDEIPLIKENIIDRYGFSKVKKVIAGGKERQDSVAAGLAELDDSVELVVVHDGARPLLLPSQLEEIIRWAMQKETAVAAVPVKDTIKAADPFGKVLNTPERVSLRAVQTPQVFRRDLLATAYRKAMQEGFRGTDDASLVERLGVSVYLVEGSYENIKLTTPEDMEVAEAILTKRDQAKGQIRMGSGYDVHRLVEGRKLILGGVEIPHTTGLLGHSDADVLLHAIMDALLGAAALGDIGRHFPDNQEQYRNISSLKLLAHVAGLIRKWGFVVGNLDATIVAQRPKLAPYIPDMIENIAKTLNINEMQVNIKATTTEGLGFTGREEGIEAHALACLKAADY